MLFVAKKDRKSDEQWRKYTNFYIDRPTSFYFKYASS